MKKIISLIMMVSILLLEVSHVDAAGVWTKYVAPDKSYSFHYPSGWKVTAEESVVAIENAKTKEQLLMVMLPYEEGKNPQQLAEGFIKLMKSDNPNMKASNWRSVEGEEDMQVIFDMTYKISSKEYLGLGVVVKVEGQAMWFSYFAPKADYYLITGYNLIQGFTGSLAFGSSSVDPKTDYKANVAGRIDKNAKAFLFVLEFALGAPFTQSQENVILTSLKDGWRYLSEEELVFYDQYPDVVKNIMKVKQKDLEKLRSGLDKVIKEWLDETDQTDAAVKIIKSTLKNKGKVIIKGKPSLTEMSLTAYSEMIAYSRMLQKDSKAKPEKISSKTVKAIKKEVTEAWKTFSKEDKESIATAPGLWVCLRAQLRYGSKEQQKEIRDSIKKLAEINGETKTDKTNTTSGVTKSDNKKPMDMTSHMSMMQIQQQTFNTYMWSRGFNYLPATGKMW